MKKAKEYASEIIEVYVENNEKDALVKAVQTIKDLLNESTEIQKARNIKNYAPMLAVLKEQHIKWQSICRHVNKEVNILDERGFLNVIEDKMTMIYPNLIAILQPLTGDGKK